MVTSFDHVVDEYDAARPGYPTEIFDALGPLAGLAVLELGAGTGVATRALRARQASVVALDRFPGVLSRAVERSPMLTAVVADGAVLPFRARSFDLVCVAQAWHWLDPERRALEAFRVLGPSGRWAGWWSHARADGEPWFETLWELVEATGLAHRAQRDTEWGADVAASGRFDVADRISVPWVRRLDIGTWMTDLASHSYIAALPRAPREELLGEVRNAVDQAFPSGVMEVPHETWLWIATVRHDR